MLDLVDVGRRTLESYRGVAPDPLLDAVRSAAEPLRGARVLHVNATPYGGGVSELLRSEVPLLNDLGLVADWRIIRRDERFFGVTKTIHNGLQGATAQVLEWIGIRVDHPLVTQVSRFDPWKDPLGVIAAYRLARREIPNLQLALVGSLALDDPEGWDVYRLIRADAGDDPLIHVFTNVVGVGNIEVNAFQTLSSVHVVVQKSIREGFGLVVSESLWKGTPVIAGRVGGIPLQMADGVGGILVDTVEACAAAIVGVIEDPQRAAALGARGRDRVREHFLLPRLLLNELALLRDLAAGRTFARAEGWSRNRDPVCGMVIEGNGVTWTVGEAQHLFCSERCRSEDPARYTRR